jgi:hypothetical protein
LKCSLNKFSLLPARLLPGKFFLGLLWLEALLASLSTLLQSSNFPQDPLGSKQLASMIFASNVVSGRLTKVKRNVKQETATPLQLPT